MADQPQRRGGDAGQMTAPLSQQQLALIEALLRRNGYAVTVGKPQMPPQYDVQVGTPQMPPQYRVEVGQPQMPSDLGAMYARGR